MFDLSTDLFFLLMLTVLSPALTEIGKRIAAKFGILWAKINQRTVSLAIGGFLGGLYRIPGVYAFFNSQPAPATVKDFVVGGALAGLAGSAAIGVWKDWNSGAIKTNTEAGLRRIRQKADARKTITEDTVRGA